MACFIAPAAEAIVTTTVEKILEKKEKKQLETMTDTTEVAVKKISVSKKIGWLSKLLWGGSALLCFEHIWHGEVVPYFPFLTAANDPADFAEMLGELSTVGVSMSILLTVVWGIILFAVHNMENTAIEEMKVVK